MKPSPFGRIGPLGLLIVQPTRFCNIDCRYCYVRDRNDRRVMHESVLEAALERVFEADIVEADFHVAYHSGEPLTAPLDFYLRADEIIQRYSNSPYKIAQYIQTNGTLIDHAWCEYFLQMGVTVCVSVDGPASIHDAQRTTRSGRGSHEATMRGIRLLQEHNVPFTTISVITEETLKNPRAFLQFFLDEGIKFVSLSAEDPLMRPSSLLTPKHRRDGSVFKEFLAAVYDEYFKHRDRLSIREFDFMEQAILHQATPTHRNLQTVPYYIVSVDVKGDFFTFSPELHGESTRHYGQFVLGNVFTDSLRGAMETDRFGAIFSDILRGVVQCKSSCDYYTVCGGGVPVSKYMENGQFDSTATGHCEFRFQTMFDVVASHLGSALSQPVSKDIDPPEASRGSE